MRVRSLIKAAVLLVLLIGAATLVLLRYPPRSVRQEHFDRWIAELLAGSPQPLAFTFHEDRGADGHSTYELSHPPDIDRILRLAQLAKEAELFRSEPINEKTPPSDAPIVEVVFSGLGQQFVYRDLRSSFDRSIAARSLRKLAEVFATQGNELDTALQ